MKCNSICDLSSTERLAERHKCTECDASYKYKAKLNLHLKKNHSNVKQSKQMSNVTIKKNKKKYKQIQTNKNKYSVKKEINNSLNTNNGKTETLTRFICTKCDSSYKYKKGLNRHFKSRHFNIQRPTNQNKENSLNLNSKCNNIIKKCSFEPEIYNSKTYNEEQTENLRKYSCLKCENSYKHKNNLNRHLKTKHLNNKESKNENEKCSKLKIKNILKKPLLQITGHSNLNEVNKKKQLTKFTCSECGASYNYKKNLDFHLKKNHKKYYNNENKENISLGLKSKIQTKKCLVHIEKFNPKRCKIAVETKNNYDFDSTETMFFKCSKCKEIYLGETEFEDHFISAHCVNNSRSLKCSECSMEFEGKQDFFWHSSSFHFKPRLHKCQFCDVMAMEVRDIEDHIASVHEQKKLFCTVCNKKFGVEDALINHFEEHF